MHRSEVIENIREETEKLTTRKNYENQTKSKQTERRTELIMQKTASKK